MVSFGSEEVERLRNIARDVQLGPSFEERMSALSESLVDLVPATSLSSMVLTLGPVPPTLGFVQGTEQQNVVAYATHYRWVDPTRHALVDPPDQPIALSDVLRDEDFDSDEYSSDFLRHNGLRYTLGLAREIPEGQRLAFSLHRDRQQGDFTAKERETIRLLAPDLVRASYACVLSARVDDVTKEQAEQPETRDTTDIVLDLGGNVLGANEHALSMWREIEAQHGILLGDLVQPRLGIRPDSQASSFDHAFPVRGETWIRVRGDAVPERAAYLLRFERISPRVSNEREFFEKHGLTRREREIAVLAASGLANKEIARDLGISPVTVNVTLGRVYAKAGLRGRVDLARALA